MSDGFGIGDGALDVTLAEANAQAIVADARRRRPDRIESGRWPGIGTVLRVMLALTAAVVVFGWLLTALNAGR